MSMSFAPISVDVALLRDVLTPELNLNIGRELMVRVADVGVDGRGTINLAGIPLDARLPANVSAGEELRLVVQDVSPERVVLQIQEQPTVSPQTAATVPEQRVDLPDGSSLSVARRPASSPASGGEAVHTLALRYDAPNFGSVDMNFMMDASGLRLALTVPAGDAYDSAATTSSELADAIATAAGRSASVAISPRREPLEVFA